MRVRDALRSKIYAEHNFVFKMVSNVFRIEFVSQTVK